jgi:hypothetical protein
LNTSCVATFLIMAPSSTAKKSSTSKSTKSSATKAKRTVVKSASSTSTSKKKIIKVKVQRKPKTTTTTNNKKKPPSKSKTAANINPSIILSKNLPVTSKPPILPTNASALRPGSLLQQICNGQDIQLSRSAVVTPNIEKEKGKYLLIFPGMFSFNKLTSTTTTTTKKAAATEEEAEVEVEADDGDGDLKPKSVNTATTKQKNDNDDDDDDADDDDDDDDDDGDEDSPLKDTTTTTTTTKKKVSATIATTPTQIHSLGRVEGLRSDIPTFKIPFADIQKDLIFPGRKVQTTSKYLIMSCSNKKNGTVQCKVCMYSLVTCHLSRIYMHCDTVILYNNINIYIYIYIYSLWF